ncbi:hypothetical protein E4U03_09145 [Rothia nasimurium]|uniref:Uncharacterized protein n=1 Tax=Rothia nasimurium TaxID=85336 RepID=A0A4Y9F2W2_9MICC|nr:hypothetical protein [Rothia nasimurium]MBF0808768.1 hypothetical protein [Rothia nasimurium]TFU21396.1 hypothetical protein E4U03_09145 [Rothia nasimurium]
MTYTPSPQWYKNWPWQQDTIVRLQASITGKEARTVVQAFLAALTLGSSRVYYSGGYCFTEIPTPVRPREESLILELYSAGEDGFDSVLNGVEHLEEFLAGYPHLTITWQELEPQKSKL